MADPISNKIMAWRANGLISSLIEDDWSSTEVMALAYKQFEKQTPHTREFQFWRLVLRFSRRLHIEVCQALLREAERDLLDGKP